MANQPKVSPPLPGLDVVGRGIYLRPRQPYELKDVLFKRDNYRNYYSRETDQTYSIPDSYEINDSPPMPAKQALNQTLIEESWERLDKQLGLDTSVTASNKLFSIDANSSQARQLRSNEEAYYALRNSFIPLWSVYLPVTPEFADTAFEVDVPTPFKHANRRAYDKFFERYGTHYVKRAWVGGKAMLAFIVSKSSQLTKEDIQSGIKASYGAIGGASVSKKQQESKEKLQSNSECRVFGKGGDELALASLSSLDEASYNAWLATIKNNPQIIELEVAGIWTLISDPVKAQALQDAYAAATTFSPISAIFSVARKIFFIRDDKYFTYDLKDRTTEIPQPLVEKCPALADSGFERADAAFTGAGLFTPAGEHLINKLYLFKRGEYIRLDLDAGEIDSNYPRSIAEGWPGVTFDRIDAALNAGADSIYFFRGNRYVRFNFSKQCADAGYPELISKRWTGVLFDRLDATIYWKNDKVYFFKDDQYIRYDMATYSADPDYPKFIIGSYVEDWKFFD